MWWGSEIVFFWCYWINLWMIVGFLFNFVFEMLIWRLVVFCCWDFCDILEYLLVWWEILGWKYREFRFLLVLMFGNKKIRFRNGMGDCLLCKVLSCCCVVNIWFVSCDWMYWFDCVVSISFFLFIFIMMIFKGFIDWIFFFI